MLRTAVTMKIMRNVKRNLILIWGELQFELYIEGVAKKKFFDGGGGGYDQKFLKSKVLVGDSTRCGTTTNTNLFAQFQKLAELW